MDTITDTDSAARPVTFVRIYVRESDGVLDKVLDLLHDRRPVAGVTVFRGIAGFGDDGMIKQSKLLSLSLDLPLVIEFFDSPELINEALQALKQLPHVQHIVTWSAENYYNHRKPKNAG